MVSGVKHSAPTSSSNPNASPASTNSGSQTGVGNQKSSFLGKVLSGFSKITFSTRHNQSQLVGKQNSPTLGNNVSLSNVGATGNHSNTRSPRLIPGASLRAPMWEKGIEEQSHAARDLVFNASIDDLQALGAGELMRLSKIISASANPSTQVTDKFLSMSSQSKHNVNLSQILLQQDVQIESKIQTAFGRSFNSTVVDPGLKAIDKLIIQCNSSMVEGNCGLNETEKKQAIKFLKKDGGQSLKGLTQVELKFIGDSLRGSKASSLKPSNIMAQRSINSAKSSAPSSGYLEFRQDRPLDSVETTTGRIQHKTTLFAEMHNAVSKTLQSTGASQKFTSFIDQQFVRAVNNHVEPNELKHTILSSFANRGARQSVLNNIEQSIDALMSEFEPTANLGRQMESPQAKRLENIFAAKCLQRPTNAMVAVSNKMIAQLKQDPQVYNQFMQEYLNVKGSYVYPVAQKEYMHPTQVMTALEQGTNLALTMDFHHFCADRALDTKPVGLSEKQEIMYTWHTKTYAQDVSSYRGDRVLLPRINTTDNNLRSIGVGRHSEAVDLGNAGLMKTPINRPSITKTAFGTHAAESAKADVAQACGTTGRGNMHLWGQAVINQSAPAALRINEEETGVFLLMVATVMTADGGHTLSETLGTAFIASRNSGSMSEQSKGAVDGLFSNMRAVTAQFNDPSNRFAHHDMIFSRIQDHDTHNVLASAWHETRAEV